MTYRVLIGLPSYCEADTIGRVTADADAAAATLPFRAEAVLVNADNASPDGTAEAFLATSTEHPKHVITTKRRGKGANTLALLRYLHEEQFDAFVSIDTDLAEVPADWIHALVGAVRDGADFCYPLRPPRWNGADLTYHLAYPVLAAIYGTDLREPLSGDLAMSAYAAEQLLNMPWTDDDLRFGGDFRIASVAAEHAWVTVALSTKRRNKLRSFSTTNCGDYRMGAKFAENAAAIRRTVRERLRSSPPLELRADPTPAPTTVSKHVPAHDPDIETLTTSTTRRMRAAARDGSFDLFPSQLARRLRMHAEIDAHRGLPWPLWRDCLVAWLKDDQIPTSTLEDLFLSRVVGHHSEIAGTTDWYRTVQDQSRDLFTHRRQLWANP